MFAPDEIKGVPLDKQSFINGVNKPFMGLFFYRDTYMIPVLIVPQILMSTKQKLSMQQQSFSLQIICWKHVEIALFNTLARPVSWAIL